MSIRIRPMRRSDVDDFGAENAAQGWHDNRPRLTEYLAQQAEGTRLVFVAEEDGHAAGYITLLPSASEGPYAGLPEIRDFNVITAFRRRGIGSVLMDAAEKAAARYASCVTLGVGLHSGYGAAQRMYVRRGYLPDGSGVWYRDQPLAPYTNCINDDDLVLYMKKEPIR